MSHADSGLDHYRRLFTQPTLQRGRLDRSTLPAPLRYLSEHALLVGKPRGEWASIRCPVHKAGDERHPSMSVSLTEGYFRCHTCGAKGGDIIALHRLVTGKGFRDAVADLGGRFQ